MKLFLIASLTLFQGLYAFAHDEGHGPKITDSGKYGGLVAPVVDLKDAKKGTKADLVYKAELVRSTDGSVRIYLYDKDMKPLDASTLENKATGILASKVKGKYQSKKFDIKYEGNSFTGQAPKALSRPFNLDFQFKEKSRELLTAFDNLD